MFIAIVYILCLFGNYYLKQFNGFSTSNDFRLTAEHFLFFILFKPQ